MADLRDFKIGQRVTYHSAYGDMQAEIVNITDRRVRIVVTETARAYRAGARMNVLPESLGAARTSTETRE